jgi:hypothetical protein
MVSRFVVSEQSFSNAGVRNRLSLLLGAGAVARTVA